MAQAAAVALPIAQVMVKAAPALAEMMTKPKDLAVQADPPTSRPHPSESVLASLVARQCTALRCSS